MPDVAEIRKAVEQMLGSRATLVQSVAVREDTDGKLAWQGLVRVFELAGGARPARVYAGTMTTESSGQRRIFAIRHTSKVNSPRAAVRAAIVTEQRRRRPVL